MISIETREALLARRPGKRTFVITHSTFAGADAHIRKWLGYNSSLCTVAHQSGVVLEGDFEFIVAPNDRGVTAFRRVSHC